MMRLDYAGGTILTGTAIARAVVRYGAALAQARGAAAIQVPGRTVDGLSGDFEVLLGPASQILVEPTDDSDEVEDEAFLADLERRISSIERPPYVLPWDEEPDLDSSNGEQ